MRITRAQFLNLLSSKLPEELVLPSRLSVWGYERLGQAAIAELSIAQGIDLLPLPADRAILTLSDQNIRDKINSVLAQGPGQLIFHLGADGEVKVQPIPAPMGK